MKLTTYACDFCRTQLTASDRDYGKDRRYHACDWCVVRIYAYQYLEEEEPHARNQHSGRR